MSVKAHPMSALKGTQQAKDLMADVRSHKGKKKRRGYREVIDDALIAHDQKASK